MIIDKNLKTLLGLGSNVCYLAYLVGTHQADALLLEGITKIATSAMHRGASRFSLDSPPIAYAVKHHMPITGY